MEYRPLNITVVSADGLKDVNLFSKMDVYTEVFIEGYPASMKKTPVDKDCGTHPKWNHAMEFVVDEPYLTKTGMSLVFQIKSESLIGSDKEIGSVVIPIDDLYKKNSSESEEKTDDFEVRTSSGKSKGTLKISYKFGEKFTEERDQKPPEEKKNTDEPIIGAAPPPATDTYHGYPPQDPYGYPAPPPGPYGGYPAPPQHPYGGYPPQGPYGGYPPHPQGPYGGYPPPPPGPYGYPPNYGSGYSGEKPEKNKMGMGAAVGLGVGAGLLGGLVIGEAASEIGDGFEDAMDDAGDFDF